MTVIVWQLCKNFVTVKKEKNFQFQVALTVDHFHYWLPENNQLRTFIVNLRMWLKPVVR